MKYVLICAGLVLVLSCKKEGEPSAVDSAEGKLLTAGPWKKTGSRAKYPGVDWEDTYSQLWDCTKDNLYIFHPDGKFGTDEGPSKCATSDPQYVSNTTWDLTEGGKILLIIEHDSLGGAELPYKITTLTEKNLSLSREAGTFIVEEFYER